MSEVTLQAAMEAVHRLTGKPVRVTIREDGAWEIECYTKDRARDDDPDRHTGWDDSEPAEMVLMVGASAEAWMMNERRASAEHTE